MNVGACVTGGELAQLRPYTRAQAPTGACTSEPEVRAQFTSSESVQSALQKFRSFAFARASFRSSADDLPSAMATIAAPSLPHPYNRPLTQVLSANVRAYSPNQDCNLTPTSTAQSPICFSEQDLALLQKPVSAAIELTFLYAATADWPMLRTCASACSLPQFGAAAVSHGMRADAYAPSGPWIFCPACCAHMDTDSNEHLAVRAPQKPCAFAYCSAVVYIPVSVCPSSFATCAAALRDQCLPLCA
jgi:hypothetical protein